MNFEQLCGLSNGYVNNIKGKIGAKKLDDILKKFPALNKDWLLTGEGPMIVEAPGVGPAATAPKTANDTRPRIPMAVAAGTLSGFAEGVSLSDCELVPVIKAFPEYDYTMIVKGNSMEPKFEGGDEIAIRKVQGIIEWGKAYVLDTRDGAILKRLYDSGGCYRCVSYNPEYPDFEISKESVFGVYKVVGLIRI